MRKLTLLTILLCFFVSVFAQTEEDKYLIKYLETNTTQPDYGVTFLSDNQFIFKSPNTEKVNTNSEKLSESNLFLATVGDEGDIIEKKEIQGLPTNKITKTGASYSPDLKTVYFSAKKYRKKPRRNDKEQMFKADVDENGNWINIEKLPFSNDRYSFGEPSLSANGNELYFTSDMPGGKGGADIYMVSIDSNGEFTKPINLGDRINTSGNEVTPFITKDNKLYFSSDNHQGGLGNLDVYYLDFNNPSSKPIHLDAPINSINDDFAFIINDNYNRGYFSSNRLQGQNNHDIYSFLVERVKEEGPCVQSITGVVKDNGTKAIIKDATITLFDVENNQLEQIKTDDEGKYQLTLDCNKTYTVKAEAKNFNTEDHIVNTANYLGAPVLEANKFLIKKSEEEIKNSDNLIAESDKIINENDLRKEDKKNLVNNTTSIEEDEATINPIFFGFDKSIITSKAAKELDKLVKILKNNEQIHVELSSYTDSRGSSAYNLKLSERRAQASLEYLVSKGIDRSRIKAKGYGESKMVNKCIDGVACSEAAHEKNRRTEFAFINPQASVNNFDNYSIKETNEIAEVKETPVKANKEVSSYSGNTNHSDSIKNDFESIKQEENVGVNSVVTEVAKTNKSTTNIPVKRQTEVESQIANSSKTSINTNVNKDVVETSNQNEEDETLSDEAKWLNSQIEKSNQQLNESINNTSTEVETEINLVSEDKNKVQSQINILTKSDVLTEDSDEFKKLAATAKAEEKVEEKFNFEREENQQKITNVNSDPNELLANVKAQGASKQVENSIQGLEDNATDKTSSYEIKKAVLSTSQVSVKGMQSKRGKYIETNNAKRVNALRVIFRVQPNNRVETGYKDAYVVIKSPSGKIVNEKGVFTLDNGNDQPYTDLTTIYYNNQSIKAVMFIDKIIHKFSKGIYTVNIFIDGVEVGENILNLS